MSYALKHGLICNMFMNKIYINKDIGIDGTCQRNDIMNLINDVNLNTLSIEFYKEDAGDETVEGL